MKTKCLKRFSVPPLSPPPIVLHGYFGGTYLHGGCDTGRRRSGHGQISNRSGNERVLHSSGRYGSGTGQRRRTRPASYTVPRLSLLSTTPLCAARLAVTRHTISTAKTLTFRFALHILTRGAYYIDFEDKNIPSSIFRRDETHVITRREYDKKKILTFLKLCVLWLLMIRTIIFLIIYYHKSIMIYVLSIHLYNSVFFTR